MKTTIRCSTHLLTYEPFKLNLFTFITICFISYYTKPISSPYCSFKFRNTNTKNNYTNNCTCFFHQLHIPIFHNSLVHKCVWSQSRFSNTSINYSLTRLWQNKGSCHTKIIILISPITLILLILTTKGSKYFSRPIPSLSILLLISAVLFYFPLPGLSLNSTYFKIDLISTSLISLTIFLIIFSFLISYPISKNLSSFKIFSIILIILINILILCFITNRFIIFYIIFEFSLIPTISLIILWGYQPERLQATIYLIIFTLSSALPILISLIIMSNSINSINIINVPPSLLVLHRSSLNMWWIILNTVFFVKLPLFILHLWLPKAHVEAPVAGSIILAGILLKLGGYGFLRFAASSPFWYNKITPIFMSLSLWGAIISALICIQQTDLKSLIAYSSVRHMGLILAASISNSAIGWKARLTIIISHGICSSALFAAAAVIYDLSHTRNLYITKGLLILIPNFIPIWFILCAFNLAAPPSINIIAEIIALTAAVSFSNKILLIIISIIFIVGAYSIILYTSVSHGQLSNIFNPSLSVSPRIFLSIYGHLPPLILFFFKPELFSQWI